MIMAEDLDVQILRLISLINFLSLISIFLYIPTVKRGDKTKHHYHISNLTARLSEMLQADCDDS